MCVFWQNRAWVEQDARERAEAARLRNIEHRASRLGEGFTVMRMQALTLQQSGFKYIETNVFLHREARELHYEDADQCQCNKRVCGRMYCIAYEHVRLSHRPHDCSAATATRKSALTCQP